MPVREPARVGVFGFVGAVTVFVLPFCPDWQDHGGYAAVLQPSLDGKGSLIVKEFLERVRISEDNLPGKER